MTQRNFKVTVPPAITRALSREAIRKSDQSSYSVKERFKSLNFTGNYRMAYYTGAYSLSNDYDTRNLSIGEVVGFFPRRNRVLMLFMATNGQRFTEEVIPSQLLVLQPHTKLSTINVQAINGDLFMNNTVCHDPTMYSRQTSRQHQRKYQPTTVQRETSYMRNRFLQNSVRYVDGLDIGRDAKKRFTREVIQHFQAVTSLFNDSRLSYDFVTHNSDIGCFYQVFCGKEGLSVLTDQTYFEQLYDELCASAKFLYSQNQLYHEDEILVVLEDFEDYEAKLAEVVNPGQRENLRRYYQERASANKINQEINKMATKRERDVASSYYYNVVSTVRDFESMWLATSKRSQNRQEIVNNLLNNIIFRKEYRVCFSLVQNLMECYDIITKSLWNSEELPDISHNLCVLQNIAKQHANSSEIMGRIGQVMLAITNTITRYQSAIATSTYQQLIQDEILSENPQLTPYMQIYEQYWQYVIPVAQECFCRILGDDQKGRQIFRLAVSRYFIVVNEQVAQHITTVWLQPPKRKYQHGQAQVMLNTGLEEYEKRIENHEMRQNYRQLVGLERDIYVQAQILSKYGVFTSPNVHYNAFPFHINVDYSIHDGQFVMVPTAAQASRYFGLFTRRIVQPLCVSGDIVLLGQEPLTQMAELVDATERFIQSGIQVIVEVIGMGMSVEDIMGQFREIGIGGDLAELSALLADIQQNNTSATAGNVEIGDFVIVKMMQQEVALPLHFRLNNTYDIIHTELANKRSMARFLPDNLYFYLFKLGVGEVKKYLQEVYGRAYQDIRQQVLQIILGFTEALIENMRLLIEATRSFGKRPENFSKLYCLDKIMDGALVTAFFDRLFEFLSVLATQFQRVFVDHDVCDKIADVYDHTIQIMALEDYIQLRGDKSGEEIEHTAATRDYRFYNGRELSQMRQNLVKKLHQYCDDVEFGELDQIQLPYIAYHRMIRELQITQTTLLQRKQSYQQYLAILHEDVCDYFGRIEGYTKTQLFERLRLVGSDTAGKPTSRDRHLSAVHENDEQNVNCTLGNIGAHDFGEYVIEPIQISLNQPSASMLQKKFELEFLVEFQKRIRIPLQSVNYKQELEDVRIKQNDELLEKMLGFLEKECKEIAQYVDLGLISLTENINRILMQLSDVYLLFRLQDTWNSWLECLQDGQSIENRRASQQLLEQIKNYGIIQRVFNNYFIIVAGHYKSRDFQLNRYPSVGMQHRLGQFYSSIVEYKMNQNSIARYVQNSDTQLNLAAFHGIVDKMVTSMLSLYKEINVALILTSEYILPQSLTSIQKQYIFVDMGLNVLAKDIFKQQQNPGFYDMCLSISFRSYFDRLVYNAAKQIYLHMAQYRIQYQIEKSKISMFIEPVGFRDSCSKFLLYLSVILNLYQNDLSNQMLIFVRDIEAIILQMREFYIVIMRLQNLINDLLEVRENGNVIEVDLTQLQNAIVESQKKQSRSQRPPVARRDACDNTELQQSIDNLKRKLAHEQALAAQRRPYCVNVLSSQDMLQVGGGFTLLREVCTKLLGNEGRMIALGTQQSHLRGLRRSVIELTQIQQRLGTNEYGNVFRVFTTKQNQRLGALGLGVQTGYELFSTESTAGLLQNKPLSRLNVRVELGRRERERNERYRQQLAARRQLQRAIYPVGGAVIPAHDGCSFPQALIFTGPLLLRYGTFAHWHPFFLHNSRLQRRFFPNITALSIEPSLFGGLVLTAIHSGNEVLPLLRYIRCPLRLYQFPDLVYREIPTTMIAQISTGRNLLECGNYTHFLTSVVYQAQLVCLSMLNKTDLAALKSHLKCPENRQQRYIAIMCRIEEYTQFPDDAPRFAVGRDNVITFGPAQLRCHNVYLGQPTAHETSMLSQHQLQLLGQLSQGIAARNAIFLLTPSRENITIKKQLEQLYMVLSRALFRRLERIHFTQHGFADQLQLLLRLLLTGHFVLLYDVETISTTQLATLIDLMLCIQNGRGEISTIFQLEADQQKVEHIKELIRKKKPLLPEDELGDEDFLLRPSSFQDFSGELGYMMMQLSCLGDLDVDWHHGEQTQDMLVLQDQERYTQIFSLFKDAMIINAAILTGHSRDGQLRDFIQMNQEFGRQFYDLTMLLDRFNNNFSKLQLADVHMIINSIQNATDKFMVSSLLMDLLLRQYTEKSRVPNKTGQRHKVNDGFQEYSENNVYQQQKIFAHIRSQKYNPQVYHTIQMNFGILANLIGSIFGATKQQQAALSQQAKAFAIILLKSKGMARVSRSSTFVRYYHQFIAPILNRDIFIAIQKFSVNNQVGIGLAYEVIMVSALLSLKRPILIDCQNHQYVQIVAQFISIQSLSSYYIATSFFDLEMVVRRASSNDVVCVIATSLAEFQKMLRVIKSLDGQSKSPRVLVWQPLDITPELTTLFGRKFSLIAELTNFVFLNRMFLKNKKLINGQINNSIVGDILSSTQIFNRHMTMEYFARSSMVFKVQQLQNIYSAAITQFLHAVCGIYQVGNSLDEYLLVRSISDFFLLRYGVLKVINNSDQSKARILQQGLCPVVLDDEQIAGELQRRMYANKADERFYRMFENINRGYSVREEYGRQGIAGLQPQEVLKQQRAIQSVPDKEFTYEKLFEILSRESLYGGRGGLTNLWYSLGDEFAVRAAQATTYQAVSELYAAVLASLINAAYLFTQFQVRTSKLQQQKNFEQLLQHIREYDPDKLGPDHMVYHQINQVLELILFEHERGIFVCSDIDIKNKYNRKQNLYKSLLSQVMRILPVTINVKQFGYLNYSYQDGQLSFEVYNFGKGILQNIDFNRFIKFTQAAEISVDGAKEQSENSVSENFNTVMANLEQNINDSNVAESQIQHNVQFDQVRMPYDAVHRSFQGQFSANFYRTINLQQQEQFLPVYFDDERVALAVLLACCMIAPVTSALVGERQSGKSTLLKASQLIVRDVCMPHFGVVNELRSKGQVFSLQERICSYYIACHEIPETEASFVVEEGQMPIQKRVFRAMRQTIDGYVKAQLQRLREQHTGPSEVEGIYNKLLMIKNTFDGVPDSHIDLTIEETATVDTTGPPMQQTDATGRTVFRYYETTAHPCFILHCSNFDLSSEVHDNMISILRDHSIMLNDITQSTFLDDIRSGQMVDKQMGPVDISDTSFVLELSSQEVGQHLSNQLLSTSQLFFQIPTINLSFLRKYFRFLHHTGHTHMNEEWVQSFLNGLNLIASDLPEKMFENFLFFRLILSGHQFHFPSYKSIVVQQRKLAQLQTKNKIVVGVKAMVNNMISGMWARIISNYDVLNLNYEKTAKDTNFSDYLTTVVHSLKFGNTQVTNLQRTMAFNQDHIFESLDIYSLINSLKSQQVDNNRITSLLERFTSLNMLGYLNYEEMHANQNTSKLRIYHPWQDTQKHGQLYICLKAVLIQMLLNVYRSKENGQLIVSKPVDKAFANKFARQMYKQMLPLQTNYDQLNKVLPYSRIFQAFLRPKQSNDVYNVLLDDFIHTHSYQLMFNQGLIASGIQKYNAFFLGHVIQLYGLCTDQIDPMLLLQVFQLVMRIESTKQKNISVMKTQIQAFNVYQQPQNSITGINAIDYLSNFKYLIVDILSSFVMEKCKASHKKKYYKNESYYELNGQVIGKSNHSMKSRSFMEHRKAEAHVAEDVLNEQDFASLVQGKDADVIDDFSESLSAEEFDLIDQNFGGFQVTMLMSLQIPKYQISLNGNGSANQYNKLIHAFASIAGYTIASNDTFKEAFQQMAKSDAAFDEDVSDNQSVSSRTSGSSGTSSQNSKTSAASSVNSSMSSQCQQEFDEEAQHIQNLQKDEKFNLYKLNAQAYNFFSQRRQDRKLIIDVQNILQTLLTRSSRQFAKKKTRRKTMDQKAGTMDLLNQLGQFMNDLQGSDTMTVDSIEFLVILQIIRFSILMALGIKPMLAFNQNQYQKNSLHIPYSNQSNIIGLTINSQLQQGLPYSGIQQGKLYGELGIFANQINQRMPIYRDLASEKTKFHDIISQLTFPDFDDTNEKLKSKLNQFFEVLLVCPQSILKRTSLHGLSLLSMINQMLAQNTFIQYIFDDEEVQNICRILSLNLGFKAIFRVQDLNAFLSVLFSVLIINDEPRVPSEQSEFGNGQLDQDMIENLGQVDDIIEHYSNAVEIAESQKTTCENQILATQFNCIDYRVHDILFLFQVSECPLPSEYQFPFQYYESFRQYQVEYARCCVFVYKKIAKLCDQQCVSFHEFARLCCRMIDNINKRISDIFKLINFVYVLYHYYDALASPAQVAPTLTQAEHFQPDAMQAEIVRKVKQWHPQSTSHYPFNFGIYKGIIRLLGLDEHSAATLINKNSKITKFGPQVIISVYEAFEMRNLLYTLLENMKTMIQMYQQYQRASCYDGILQTLYLLFEQSGSISHEKVTNVIKQGRMSKSCGNCFNVVKQVLESQGVASVLTQYDLFLVFCVSTMQQAGFNVDISDKAVDIIQPQQDPTQPSGGSQTTVYVCQKQCSPNVIHNQMVQFNAMDTPILLILQQFGIKQRGNDPELISLHNLCILSEIMGKSIFFLQQNILQACCCLLESLYRRRQSGSSYVRQTLATLQGKLPVKDQKFTSEMLKKVTILNLQTSTREFTQLLARTIALSDNLIVFANFGETANMDNLSTMRKFLQLRARRVIKKRQTVLIGHQTSLCNQALHKFKVLISYAEGCDLIAQIKRAGLYYQDFIDQVTFLGKNEKQQLLIEQDGYIQSQIFQAVFGERSTQRFFVEEFRNIGVQTRDLLVKMKRATVNYFWFNVFESEYREHKEKEAELQHQSESKVVSDIQVESLEQDQPTEANYEQDQAPQSEEADQEDDIEDNIDDQVCISDEEFIEKVQSYLLSQRLIVETGMRTSYILNQNYQQLEELNQVVLNIKELIHIQQQNVQILQGVANNPGVSMEDRVPPDQVKKFVHYRSKKSVQLMIKPYLPAIDAKYHTKQVILQVGQAYCRQVAISISYIFDIVLGFSRTHIQTCFLFSDTLVDKLCEAIAQQVDTLVAKCRQVQGSEESRLDKSWIDVRSMYPIEYALSYEKQLLNEYLISIAMPMLLQLLTPSVPQRYSKAFYFVVNLVFISLLYQDRPIQSKCEISQFLEKIINSMHSTEADDIRMVLGNQLISIFSENSRYSVNPAVYRDTGRQFDNLADLLPQITKMAKLLQENWIKLISFQNYEQISSIIPWLLKHHSTFVTISQCQNLFAAFVLYYGQKQPAMLHRMLGIIDLNKVEQTEHGQERQVEEQEEEEEQEQHEDVDVTQEERETTRNQLLRLLRQQLEDDRKLNMLPQQLEELNTYTLNTVFLLCNLLQPTSLEQNIDFYLYMVIGFLGLHEVCTYNLLQEHHYASVDAVVSGTIQEYGFTGQQERIRAVTKCSIDLGLLYTNLLQRVQNKKFTTVRKLPHALVAESCFILTELFQLAASRTQQYYNQVMEIINKEDYDPQKHEQHIAILGPTPHNIYVIFYNDCIDMRATLMSLYATLDLPIFNNIPLSFASFFSIQQSCDQVIAAFADPSRDGTSILAKLVTFAIQKKTLYQYVLQMPIFLLVRQDTAPLPASTHAEFVGQLSKLASVVELTFSFVHSPQSMKQQYTRSLFILMVEAAQQLQQTNMAQFDPPPNLQVHFLNAIFEQIVMQTRGTLLVHDTEIRQASKRLLENIKYNYDTQIDLRRDSWQVKAIAQLHKEFLRPRNVSDLIHTVTRVLFRPRSVIYNVHSSGVSHIEQDNNDLFSKLQNDIQRINQIAQTVEKEEEEEEQSSERNSSPKQITIDFTQLEGNQELDEDELNFRETNSDNFEEMDEVEQQQASSGDELMVDEEHNLEDSVYSNVLGQMVLYEMHYDITGQLNLEQLERNMIRLLKCQNRIFREKKTTGYVEALHKIMVQLFQSVHADAIFQQLLPVVCLLQKYYAHFVGAQRAVSNSIRCLLSSNVITEHVYCELQGADAPLPPLLGQYVNNLRKEMAGRLSKQFSPRFLFNNLVNPRINRQTNTVLGDNRFGAFEDAWVFSACAFSNIMHEILVFVRFRNSVITGSPYSSQKVIMFLEKLRITEDGGKVSINPPGDDTQDFYIIVRELELINASYDTVLNTLCSENHEMNIGYRQVYDAYCYTLISSAQDLVVPSDFAPIPFIINGKFITYVYVRRKPGDYGGDAYFTITDI